MEEDSNPQPADKKRKLNTTDDDQKDTTTSQIQTLADSVDAIGLGTPVEDLESHDVEGSSKKHQDSVVDENLQDLLYLENRLDEFLNPSTDPILRSELPWCVLSDLLRAMFRISTQRTLGGALIQYVDELRLRTNLTDSSKNHRLQVDLTEIVTIFKRLVTIEKTREITRERRQDSAKSDEQKLISLQKKVFRAIISSYGRNRRLRIDTPMSIKRLLNVAFEMFFTDSEVEEGKIKSITIESIERLYSLMSELSSIFRYNRAMIMNQWNDQEFKQNLETTITKLIIESAQRQRSACKEHENDEIEKAVTEIILQAINFFDAFDLSASYRPRMARKLSLRVRDKLQELAEISRQQTVFRQRSKVSRVPVVEHCKSGVSYTPQHSKVSHVQVVGHSESAVSYAAKSSPSEPRTTIGAIGAGVGGAVGAMAGALIGPIGAGISAVGAAAYAGAAVGSAVASRTWNPFAEEEVETQLRPPVTSSSYTPVDCVATPFSNPVYLKGGSGGGGGGGSDDSDDGGGDGVGDEGGNRGGEGRRMPDPNPFDVFTRRQLDALRSLSDAINDLCRITSQINGIQNDCREMLLKLDVHIKILLGGQPTSALSYEECVDELLKLREPIVLLNNDQPMSRLEFFRTLRYIISAVCKTSDLAAQCGYLLKLRDCDRAAAKVGVVDVPQLKKTVGVAQFTCYKMLQFNLGQAREEAVHLKKQVEDLLAALADAAKRSLTMKEQIEFAATNIQHSTLELDVTLQLDNRENISTAIIRLLSSIKRVGVLTEDPDIVPIAANISEEAFVRHQDVINNAKRYRHYKLALLKALGFASCLNLIQKASILVEEVKNHENLGDDSTLLTWNNGREVTREFEELLVAVRKSGRSAGFIEDQEPELPREGVSEAIES